ncbi:S8 family serine peptidase [Glaciibacter sp. 2TAF33]|uniref:S8 family serine peptidase n=1 Tax=Glaciibacter sp. 2TAF33 TaxID=3233015 RepID=UPI003F904123
MVATAALVGGTGAAIAAPSTSVVPGITQPVTEFTAGRYIVTLADDAVATYEGGVNGFSATAPDPGKKLDAQSRASESYSNFLHKKQKEVAASVDASIGYSYTLALNGFSADLTAAQAARLSAQKNVASITPDTLGKITAVPSTDFLGLSGPNGVWAGVGGPEHAGEGIVIGVIDTGIAPENPSFAGAKLGTTPGAEPYLDGDTVTYNKADGATFTGVCTTGVQFTADDCSTKIVSARYYVDGFGADRIGGVDVGEYLSPRDGDGHGSHTASTAGGNHDVQATVGGLDYGLISGVAPAAKIAAYKVCWSGPDPDVTTDDGCANSDSLAAIDQAVADGVDVINYSIGSASGATSTVSPTDQAFLGAAAAGVFVAASAGNSGPGASTLDNVSPWITTVAASTIPSYEATATLGDGSAFAGASITVDRTPGAPELSGPLVRGDLVAVAGHDPADALLCAPDSLDPAKVAGTIVFCQRGVYDRVAKSAEVLRAGGIGMLLVNKTPSSIDTDLHSVPTIHLNAEFWDATFAYAATPGATVSFAPGNTTGITPPVPQVAGFSSRGPVAVDGGDLLKPDITAPGVAILADAANAEGGEPAFQFISGTSMASPHIAGLAALYLGERPKASPAEVKSAMMTTAYNTLDEAGAEVTDPFAQGAGHADPTKYFEPGLLYLNGTADWLAYIQGIGYDVGVDPIDPSNLNLPSIAIGALTGPETITRTVTSTQAGTFTAQPIDMPGIDAVVSPSTLTFGGPGESASYTVTFSRTDAPLDQYATGSLDWVSGSTVVHSPIAVQPVTLVAPESVSGTGVNGSVDVSITPGGDGDIPLSLSGLAAGVRQPDPADPTNPHTGSGVATDEFSYQVEVPAGVQLARFDLNSVDDTADLDLTVYQLDGDGGNPVAGWQSATARADERVDIESPEAGFYRVDVSVFSGSTAFDVTTFALMPGAGDGAFTANPPVISGEQGVPATYTLSWAGLAPHTSYLGTVGYGDTGLSTVVAVESGDAPAPDAPVNTVPPMITGTPAIGSTLTASPGEWNTEGLAYSYQWQANGVDIARATNATYRVTKADAGTTLTVVVTASKDGLPSASATSAGVVVKYDAKVTLSLSKHVAFSWQRVTVKVTVTSKGDAGGTVDVKVGSKHYDVALDAKGAGSLTLPKLSRGLYPVTASYAGSDTVSPAKSRSSVLWIVF